MHVAKTMALISFIVTAQIFTYVFVHAKIPFSPNAAHAIVNTIYSSTSS